jgi:hypothetical protein
MVITTKLKERFCKDCNIPIHIFQEPYFTDRLKLYDQFYGTLEKWNTFIKELEKYHCEQDYFEEYNRVKDTAISSIKNSEAYQRFVEEDMNQYYVNHKYLPGQDIYHPDNDGKTFISIDMKKANFSSLQHYDSDMFAGAPTWEDYINLFTDNKHIINSKYIRQVILGNCNPKRHITYEKYLMDGVVDFVTTFFMPLNKIVFFSNDEIVFDITDDELNVERVYQLQKILDCKATIPLKVELFTLHKINGTNGYYKEIFKENGQKEIKFKCLDNLYLPFVIRYFLGEEVTENDKVFYHEGLLAQFVEVPEIEVNI